MNKTGQTNEKKSYRVILLLAIGLAAFSSAMKELNQIQSFTIETGRLITEWSSAIVPTASAGTLIVVETCTDKPLAQRNSDEFRWSGTIAEGAAIEIRGINGDIVAEPATGSDVEVVAVKKARGGDLNSVQMKVVQHPGGVTICALYPTEDGGSSNSCEPGSKDGSEQPHSSGNRNIRNNDVQVDFTVRVPARVGFIGRTINGEISATSLSSNVITRTINGSIKISTSGYGQAETMNGQISARLGDTNWPKSLAFKTLNGGITLDLPANLSTDVEAQTLNGSIVSDFPLDLTNLNRGKRVQGRIGAGGRELLLKTLNGSINLRIAS
jgi:hypothetical protein